MSRAVRACHLIEHLETRVLLSSYTLSAIPFGAANTGSNPNSRLVADAVGNLYGTTSAGGTVGQGTVFEVARGGGTINTLVSFPEGFGADPGVTVDAAGNLYGTTNPGKPGGPSYYGAVFKIPSGTGTIQKIGSLDPQMQNHVPWAYSPGGVVADADGNLYGTVVDLGAVTTTCIFSVPKGASVQRLNAFGDQTDIGPSGLTLDASGHMFGTTSKNGAHGFGTVFECEYPFGSTIQTLAAFDGTNGPPSGGVTLDAAGNLFGTTRAGGASGVGTVFEVPKGTGTILTLASFNTANGAYPSGGVVLDRNGNIYGTTSGGGASGAGTVFEIPSGTGTIQTLASFDGTNGSGPNGVTLGQGGNLFGTTSRGGPTDQGTFFKLAASAPTPYLGRPFNVATDTIEAEDFDNGGEGLAYHDTTPENIPGAYRKFEGVDVASVADASNGFAVGYTAPGEWLTYSINAPAQQTYALQARVANYQQGGTFHVTIDGVDVTGSMTVPDTGPWDTWQTITSKSFTVSAGNHTMQIVMDSPGYWGNIGDFDSFKFVGRTPFHGTPFNISTDTIQAEDFDNGGEGIAFHDTTPQNIPGAYRTTAVDVAPVSNASNGYAVGYTAPGEWLDYSITVPSAGTYTLDARVANYKQGGTFHVEIDGTNVTGAITVPDTGPWDTWQTITSQAFNVSAGSHVMRAVMDTGGYWGNIADFDSFKFAVPAAYLGHPFKVGTETIEAENFDNGGEGNAFHDTTTQNLGGKYRTTAVDINPGGSNGFDVGYTAPGEWLKYSITNPTAGTFVLQSSVASSKPGGTFHVEIDGQNVTGPMTVPDTAGWFNFQTVTSPKFSVAAGDHTMRVVMDSAGALGAVGNFDYFRFAPAGIVTLVSQERYVNIDLPYPTQDQVVATEPGDFGPFEGALTYNQNAVWGNQSSRLDVTPSGAKLTASLGAFAPPHGNSAWSFPSFDVVFDVDSPVTYKITAKQGYSSFSFGLKGPNGAVSIPYDSSHDRDFSTGMLQPGRYTFSADVFAVGFGDVTLDLGSSAVDRPLLVAGQTIEAEAFDDGAEGVAYHDTTPQNQGGQYRATGVDINPGGSYGFNVGYTAPGEWLRYSLTNPSAGDFVLQAAVASSQVGGTFHVEIDGQNVTGTMTVPNTAGWYNFQTVVSPKFHVSAGDHTMKVVMDSAGASGAIGNFDYFRFVPTGVVTLVSQQRSITLTPAQSAGVRTVEADPGNFGTFQATMGETAFLGARASQSSDLKVGDTGARFSASAGVEYSSWGNQLFPSSSFQVVFDVGAAVAYNITFDHHADSPSLKLDGPGGPVFNYDPSQSNYFSSGTLQAGRYTLYASVFSSYDGGSIDLQMELGSAITPTTI